MAQMRYVNVAAVVIVVADKLECQMKMTGKNDDEQSMPLRVLRFRHSQAIDWATGLNHLR